MTQYRTQIIIPPDRIVTLILPDDLPPGSATIVIEALGQPDVVDSRPDCAAGDQDGHEVEDIEWWDRNDQHVGA